MAQTNSKNRENDFEEALRQFVDAGMRGEKPDIDEFVDSYPEFENQIRQKVQSFKRIDALFDSIMQSDESEFGDTATGDDLVGQKVGSFEIVEIIGRGGMGVVYLARDTKLDRSVAVKSIPAELQASSTAQARFQREAKLLASLNHSNIAVIHEIIEQDEGASYLVLEYVPGQTLAEQIAKDPLKLQETLTIALQIAEAMAAAHEHDVIHRDLKPGNIKITPDGRVKVLDFGLAKAVSGEASEQPAAVTQPGRVIGTPAYMSPEQARGKPTDKRSDIWSFGCVLYEMLTGKIPFEGETISDTLAHILDQDPDWQFLPREAGPQVRKVLYNCLEKNPDNRYQSATQIRQDLYSYQATLSAKAFNARVVWRAIRRPRVAVCIILILLTLGFGLSRLMHRSSKVRWARVEAIPEIIRLIDQGKYLAAFSLAGDAEKYIPNDPMLTRLWPQIAKEDCSVITSPPGANIFIKEYSAIMGEWRSLGKSPLQNIQLARGIYRWKITKEGFEDREFVVEGQTLDVELWQEGSLPSGMVLIPSEIPRGSGVEAAQGPAYLIDKYEVTNEQFKEFVESGGYQNHDYWKHKFTKNGREFSWEQAMIEFRDKTGRPGPSTWEGGTYPRAQGKYPVSGVSWYEAAAYAEFAGKSLPTTYHWLTAACAWEAIVIVPFSNFKGNGPAPVGSNRGMGRTGLYDMAGNVREWCFNTTDDSADHRHILGGACGEQTYMFTHMDTRSAWNRAAVNGFRCVQYPGGQDSVPDSMFGPVEHPYFRDYSGETPVSEQEFRFYKQLYAYDRAELYPVIESVDDSSDYWRREKITFDAAYGGERVVAYLFLPKEIKPPYQTVIYFPGISAVSVRSFEGLPQSTFTEFVIMSGRALMCPVYKGTYEREIVGGRPDKPEEEPIAYRDWVIQLAKDMMRSVDYLERRPDIDSEKIAYYGLSWGAWLGPIMLTVEERIKLGILVVGGLPYCKLAPAADPINFAPRVKVPVVIVGGEQDYIFPVETSLRPLHKLLGSAHKELKTYAGGHGSLLALFSRQITGDVLDWLDRYLGPVD